MAETLYVMVMFIAAAAFFAAAIMAIIKLVQGFVLAFKRCWWGAILCLFIIPLAMLVWIIVELIICDESKHKDA